LITTLSTGASGIHIDCSAQRTKAIGKATDSFSSAVKPVMLAREYDTMRIADVVTNTTTAPRTISGGTALTRRSREEMP